MAPTFSLATILAIAISLGVVALACILVLGIVVIRHLTVSNRERRAYDLARKGDYRRSSLSNSAERSYKYRNRRSCIDVLCCIPPIVYDSSRPRRSRSYSPRPHGDETPLQNLDNNPKRQEDKQNQNKSSTERIKPEDIPTRSKQSIAQSKTHKDNKVEGLGVYSANQVVTPQKQINPGLEQYNHFQGFNAAYGSTPGSVRSIPVSPSPKGSTTTFRSLQTGSDRFFSANMHDQNTRQPLTNYAIGYDNNTKSSLLPTPPGITVPSTPRSQMSSRVNSIKQQNSIESWSQNSPSFASKLKTLAPAPVSSPASIPIPPSVEPLYPAKSELRNISSYKKFDIGNDETPNSMREYYSAKNSLKSDQEVESPLSYKRPNFKQEQVLPLNQSSNSASKQTLVKGNNLTQPKYLSNSLGESSRTTGTSGETPNISFSKTREGSGDGFSELFKSPESHINMTPSQPLSSHQPSPVSSYRTQSADGTPIKHSQSINNDNMRNFDQNLMGSDNGIPVNYYTSASQSNNSVVDSEKLMKALKHNDHVVEGRERIGVTHISRGHSVTPSYTGSVVGQPLSQAQLSQYPSDLLRTYQLAESMNRISQSSGSKQTTPVDKMSNFDPQAPLFPSSNTNEANPISTQNVNVWDKRNLQEQKPDIRTKIPETENDLKRASRGNIQLSSPLSSPGSSYAAPSRNSSLSSKSFGRSRSLIVKRQSINAIDDRKERENSNTKLPAVKKLYISPNASKETYSGGGTISTIAALYPPASPRSPGYEPGKGAMMNGNTLSKIIHKTGTSVKRLSGYATKVDKPIGGNKARRTYHQIKSDRKPMKQPRIYKPLPSTPIIVDEGIVGNLNGAKFVAIAKYRGRLTDEIDLEIGDVVKVNEIFDDHWCRAHIVQSSQPTINRNMRGVCPKACLAEKPI